MFMGRGIADMTTPPDTFPCGKVFPPLRKLLRPGVCLGVLILLLMGLIETRGQEPPPLPGIAVSGAGVELWSAVLHLHGLQLWEDEAKVAGAETVVIHLGRDLRYLVRQGDQRRDELLQVLRGGGGILIATDGELDLTELGLRFQGGEVRCDDARMIHRNRPSCLYLVPQEELRWHGAVPEGGGPRRDSEPAQLMQALHRVSCNVSGYLLLDPKRGPLQPLARFPQGSYLHDEVGGKDLPLPASAIFAAGGQWSRTAPGAPAATILALADHSVFINQMLIEAGTDNWELARRVAVCLRGSPPRRWYRLYVNGSRVSSREVLQALLSAPVPPVPPLPPPPPSGFPDFWALQKKLTELGNRAIQTAQERDLPNTVLLGSPEFPVQRQARWTALLKLIAILALAGALGLLWRGVQQSRSSQSFLARTGQQSSQQPRRGWFQRRSPAMSEPEWSEAIRRVLRDFFIQTGAGDPASTPVPPIVVVLQVPQAEKWRRQLQTLWRYAREPTPHLTLQQWPQWERVLEELMQAQRDGLWRLTPAEEGRA